MPFSRPASAPFIASFILSSIFLVSVYAIATTFLFKTDKQRAWIITAVSSFVMTLGSLPFVLQYLLYPNSLSTFYLMHTDLSIALCGFFVAYLVSDLAVGYLCYRKLINPLSGWFHHSLYLCVVSFVLWMRVSGVFCIFLVLELPTFILAVGSLDGRYRKDKVFGAVFFSTRIVFHSVMIWEVWKGFEGLVWVMPFSVLPLHCMWFRGWVKQQRRKRAFQVVVGVERLVKAQERNERISLKDAINENARVARVKKWCKQRFLRGIEDNQRSFRSTHTPNPLVSAI